MGRVDFCLLLDHRLSHVLDFKMTDQERAMQRAKNPGKSSWRAWQGTSEQVKRDKEKAERVAPLHSRVIR